VVLFSEVYDTCKGRNTLQVYFLYQVLVVVCIVAMLVRGLLLVTQNSFFCWAYWISAHLGKKAEALGRIQNFLMYGNILGVK
jgi:hypothetical protein